MKKLIALIFLLSLTYADSIDLCIEATDFKGKSLYSYQEYKVVNDGFYNNPTFKIKLRGDNATVSPNNLLCLRTGNYMATCIGNNIVESWAINLKEKKIQYTKNTVANDNLKSSVKVFLGDITNLCK